MRVLYAVSVTRAKLKDAIDYIELASLNFDQWNLSVSLRQYRGDEVEGMVQLVFPLVTGFRYLDEGDMLSYPFPEDAIRSYYHEIHEEGWYSQEQEYGNVVSNDCREFVIATMNECVCILTSHDPTLIEVEGV